MALYLIVKYDHRLFLHKSFLLCEKMQPLLFLQIYVEGEIQSIAVDWISGVLYWLESSSAHHAIMAATIHGRYKKTLFNTDLYKPRDLIIDPLRG